MIMPWLPLNTGPAGEDFSVVYSYEVEWKPSDVKWADRWDIYLMETPDNEVHYFSIINSLMVAILLTGAVGIIMIRALRKDIREYNHLDEQLLLPRWRTHHRRNRLETRPRRRLPPAHRRKNHALRRGGNGDADRDERHANARVPNGANTRSDEEGADANGDYRPLRAEWE